MLSEEKLKSIYREQEEDEREEETELEEYETGGFSLIKLQTVLCVVFAAALMILYFFAPRQYKALKSFYMEQGSVFTEESSDIFIFEE